MSKLAAIASIGKKIIGSPHLKKLNSHHLHLAAGAYGAYRGAVGASRTSSEHWRGETRELRNKYRKAYGKDAFKLYRQKKIISRTITSARAYYEGARFVTELSKPRTSTVDTPPAEHLPKESFAKRTLKYIRKNGPSFAKEAVKGMVVDAALENGVSNLYGGAMQGVYHRRKRLQQGIAKVQAADRKAKQTSRTKKR